MRVNTCRPPTSTPSTAATGHAAHPPGADPEGLVAERASRGLEIVDLLREHRDIVTEIRTSRRAPPLASRRFSTPTRSATRARRTSVSALTAHQA
jgi:hypothetical protein